MMDARQCLYGNPVLHIHYVIPNDSAERIPIVRAPHDHLIGSSQRAPHSAPRLPPGLLQLKHSEVIGAAAIGVTSALRDLEQASDEMCLHVLCMTRRLIQYLSVFEHH